MKNNKVHNIIRTGEGETIEFKRWWEEKVKKRLGDEEKGRQYDGEKKRQREKSQQYSVRR